MVIMKVKIPATPYYINAMRSEYLSNYSTVNIPLKIFVGFEKLLQKTYGARTSRLMGDVLVFDSEEQAIFFKLRFG